jgi:L-fuculose-phosphate aldolase
VYGKPQRVAATLSRQTPVLLIQNDSILTTGQSILEAFDRLEVAEYSAKALIDTVNIGALVPIGDDELRQLEEKFHLDK